MIKGCQRKIILINGSESSIFESAYFVLKKSAEHTGTPHKNMIHEANRIIEQCLPENAERIKRRNRLRRFFYTMAAFICGALTGGGAMLAIGSLFSFPT